MREIIINELTQAFQDLERFRGQTEGEWVARYGGLEGPPGRPGHDANAGAAGRAGNGS